MGDSVTADMNISELAGRTLKLSEIQHQANAMPFLAEKRLVIVTDYLKHQSRSKKELKPLLDFVSHLAPTTDLVFVEQDSLDKRHPLLKVADAKITEFKAPSIKTLPRWINQRVKKEKASINPDAVDLLTRLVGPNLRLLNNELEKLLLHAYDLQHGQFRPITKADVELLVPYQEEAENFGFSNAIGRRNAHQAYDQLHKMLDEGRHPMQILAALATQIRGLLEVKDLASRGMNAQAIAEAKGWRSHYAAQARLRDARNFSMERLEETLEALLETDLAIKTGRVEAGLALDMLVGELCGASC